ncbi:MAG: STAS domain-containing protein [Candidatus Riflebacteria bacterium]|nr:STAS domain-containing protein [Candidatus Riflebacteria bacterium]
MNIERNDETLFFILPTETGIANVEPDMDRVRQAFSNTDGLKTVIMNVDNVKEMDTAYFQLILSLYNTVDELGLEFHLNGESQAFLELLHSYGLKLR